MSSQVRATNKVISIFAYSLSTIEAERRRRRAAAPCGCCRRRRQRRATKRARDKAALTEICVLNKTCDVVKSHARRHRVSTADLNVVFFSPLARHFKIDGEQDAHFFNLLFACRRILVANKRAHALAHFDLPPDSPPPPPSHPKAQSKTLLVAFVERDFASAMPNKKRECSRSKFSCRKTDMLIDVAA